MKNLKHIILATLLPLLSSVSYAADVPGAVGGLVANTGSVDIAASAMIDSYDAGSGPYGRANVNNNVSVVALGSVSVDPAAYFQGSAFSAASDQLRLENMPVPTGLINSGDFIVPDGNEGSLAAGDYLFSSFTLGTESFLEIEAPVRIWVDGAVIIMGEIETSNYTPSDFWIMGTDNTSSVQITGSDTVMIGNVYAPKAIITIAGAEMFGSATGATVNIGASASVHYDETTPALAAGLQSAYTRPFALGSVIPRSEDLVLGPVPAAAGQPICLFPPKPVTDTDWNVFNAVGERVATLDFENQHNQCWNPQGLAPGVYLVHIAAAFNDGSRSAETRKVVVQ